MTTASQPPQQSPPSDAASMERLLECLDFDPREASFSRMVEATARAVIALFNGEYGTLWIPCATNDSLAMGFTTFPDEFTKDLSPMLAGRSRTRLCLESGGAKRYGELSEEPACIHRQPLEQTGCTATWCLPIDVGNLIPNRPVRLVLTVDGRPEKLVTVHESDAYVRRAVRWAAQNVERAVYSEQDALLRHVVDAMHGVGGDRMDQVAVHFRDTLGFQSCTVLAAEPEARLLRLAATTGLAQSATRGDVISRYGGGTLGIVAQSRQISAMDSYAANREELGAFLSGLDSDDAVDFARPRQQVVIAPIAFPSDALLGVVRLRNKVPVDNSELAMPLNVLDVQRVVRAAIDLCPLLSLHREQNTLDAVLRTVRHESRVPATMIRDAADYYRHLEDKALQTRLPELKTKLADCEMLAEIMILMSALTRVPLRGQFELRVDRPVRLLAEVVAPLVNMIRPLAKDEKGYKLGEVFYDTETFHLPGTSAGRFIPPLLVDGALVRVALFNILENACKYGLAGTKVRVYAEVMENPSRYAICVEGVSIQIERDEEVRIFDPLYRTPAARAKAVTGVGLGLATAAQIMRRHEGSLVLRRPANPAVFALEFPAYLQHREPSDATS